MLLNRKKAINYSGKLCSPADNGEVMNEHDVRLRLSSYPDRRGKRFENHQVTYDAESKKSINHLMNLFRGVPCGFDFNHRPSVNFCL